MELDRKELKRRAREQMGKAVPAFWVVAATYVLLTTGVSLTSDFLSSFLDSPSLGTFSTLAIFLSLLVTLYTTVVDFGYKLWSLWTWRQLDPGLNSLLQGFSVAGRVLWMEVLICLRVIPWILLLSLGASLLILFLFPAEVFIPVLSLAIALFMSVGLWLILLRYALAPYLLADRPDDGAGAAVRRSAGLMRGWTWELFKLELSFLGWELILLLLRGVVVCLFLFMAGSPALQALDPEVLAVQIQEQVYSLPVQLLSSLLTLPVLVWLTPYREVSRAGFYDERFKLYQNQAPEMPPL